jgi:hypothetical protein
LPFLAKTEAIENVIERLTRAMGRLCSMIFGRSQIGGKLGSGRLRNLIYVIAIVKIIFSQYPLGMCPRHLTPYSGPRLSAAEASVATTMQKSSTGTGYGTFF